MDLPVIEEIRIRRLQGTMETDGPLWEERLVRPVDVYEAFRVQGPDQRWQVEDGVYRVTAFFLQLEADGAVGIAGPLTEDVAVVVAQQLRPLLVGSDPFATEYLWDVMHRSLVHGRQGTAMMAISAVDCALWDLKGRVLGQPVYRLIGGPTRRQVPAYASMLGFDVTDPGLVRARAQEYQQKGYRAQKWFFRHGPAAGAEGLRRNIELVRTVREAVGEDDDIMFDCWQSMDLTYVTRLLERIEQFAPRWLEEPAMPDRIDTYRQIRRRTRVPISGAEHEYTRWGMKRFVEAEALDVLQPDIYWAGGLSEVLKIAAYATTHDLITIPHGHSTQASIHFSVSQSPVHTPYQEYLIKWNAVHQHFLSDPVTPADGLLTAPETPGLGMDLDPAKIEVEEAFLSG